MNFKELKEYYPTFQKIKERYKIIEYNKNIEKQKKVIVNELNNLIGYNIFEYDNYNYPNIKSYYFNNQYVKIKILNDIKELTVKIEEIPPYPMIFFRGYRSPGYSCDEEFSISEDGDVKTNNVKRHPKNLNYKEIFTNLFNDNEKYEKFKKLYFNYYNLKNRYHKYNFHIITYKLIDELKEKKPKIKNTKEYTIKYKSKIVTKKLNLKKIKDLKISVFDKYSNIKDAYNDIIIYPNI